MKKFIIKLAAVLCIIGLLFSILPFFYTAEAATDEKKIQECKDILLKGDSTLKIKGYDAELKDFLDFLDANFQNTSATSSLTELAIARYREYRDSLKSQFDILQASGVTLATKAANDSSNGFVLSRVATFDDRMAEYALCEELVNTYTSKGREIMMSHIRTAAAQKKTVMLLEKYKTLNTKLRELNMKTAQMYGLFATFANKLPGYICEKCMKK